MEREEDELLYFDVDSLSILSIKIKCEHETGFLDFLRPCGIKRHE